MKAPACLGPSQNIQIRINCYSIAAFFIYSTAAFFGVRNLYFGQNVWTDQGIFWTIRRGTGPPKKSRKETFGGRYFVYVLRDAQNVVDAGSNTEFFTQNVVQKLGMPLGHLTVT